MGPPFQGDGTMVAFMGKPILSSGKFVSALPTGRSWCAPSVGRLCGPCCPPGLFLSGDTVGRDNPHGLEGQGCWIPADPVGFLPPAGFASVSGLASVGASHHGARRKLGASKPGLSSAWLTAREGGRRGDGGP